MFLFKSVLKLAYLYVCVKLNVNENGMFINHYLVIRVLEATKEKKRRCVSGGIHFSNTILSIFPYVTETNLLISATRWGDKWKTNFQ